MEEVPRGDLPLATDDGVAEGASFLISSDTVDELIDTKVQKTLSSKQVSAKGVVWKPDTVDSRGSRDSSRSSKGELHDEDLDVKIEESLKEWMTEPSMLEARLSV